MNRLEDAPELKAAFKNLWDDIISEDNLKVSYRDVAEHFFIAGRDSLRDECESVKPKRKIVQLISHNGALHALCSEGKIWIYEQSSRDCDWHMAGELFKD